MDVTEQLRAWGAAHAEARAAERSAQQAGPADRAGDLQRQAKTLRERADRLHRDIYRSLDRRSRDTTD
jgi:hypothetical protein